MVRTSTKRRKTPVRRVTRSGGVAKAVAPPVTPPMTVAEARARLEMAERGMLRMMRTTRRFARNSSHEVMNAAMALREPLQLIMRTMLRAGRNIGRDARAAWLDLMPAMRAGKA